MPLTEDLDMKEGQKGEGYTPVPAGIYQVVISDVSVVDGTDFITKESIKQLMFKTSIVEEGEHAGHGLGLWTKISWFNGLSSKGTSLSPSKLYSVVKAIYSHYHKAVDLDSLTIDDVRSKSFMNDLIGKQLMIVVDLRDGKNKITGFSPIKKELEVPEKVTKEPDGSEDVDPDDIPL